MLRAKKCMILIYDDEKNTHNMSMLLIHMEMDMLVKE